MKRGLAKKSTTFCITYVYIGIFWKYHNFPTTNEVFSNSFNLNINDYFMEMEKNPSKEFISNLFSLINENTYPLIILDNDELTQEELLSEQLDIVLKMWCENYNFLNQDPLCEILIVCSITSPSLLEKLLSNDYVRLLNVIINEDSLTVKSYFDKYATIMDDLYKLALCCERSNINYLIRNTQEAEHVLSLNQIFEYLRDDMCNEYSFNDVVNKSFGILIMKCATSPILTADIRDNLLYFQSLYTFLKTLPINNHLDVSNLIQ